MMLEQSLIKGVIPAALQVCALPRTTSEFSRAGNRDCLNCAASRHTVIQWKHIPSALSSGCCCQGTSQPSVSGSLTTGEVYLV